MLSLIIDTVLPGDEFLKLPPASAIGLDIYIDSPGKQVQIDELQSLVNKVCLDKFAKTFTELVGEDRLRVLEACKRENVRLFVDFITNLFRVYYTNAEVLRAIHSGSTPPFPVGNSLEADDWGILEPVFERGRVYRPVNA